MIIGTGVYAVGLAGVALTFLIAIAIAITGIGQGIYLAIDVALAASVLPEGGKEAAKDLGVLNIANAVPQSLAPAIAPIFLAIGAGNNYVALFAAAAASRRSAPRPSNPSRESADVLHPAEHRPR